jgi:hypothetical protein
VEIVYTEIVRIGMQAALEDAWILTLAILNQALCMTLTTANMILAQDA